MPHLTLDDLKTRISDATRRLNPSLFPPAGLAGLGAQKHSQPAGTLDRRPKAKRGRKAGRAESPGWCVTFIAFGVRRMDDDNLAHSLKPARDAVADWLGIDDGDPRLRWEYGQVETREKEGTALKIEKFEL